MYIMHCVKLALCCLIMPFFFQVRLNPKTNKIQTFILKQICAKAEKYLIFNSEISSLFFYNSNYINQNWVYIDKISHLIRENTPRLLQQLYLFQNTQDFLNNLNRKLPQTMPQVIHVTKVLCGM